MIAMIKKIGLGRYTTDANKRACPFCGWDGDIRIEYDYTCCCVCPKCAARGSAIQPDNDCGLVLLKAIAAWDGIL